MLLSLAAVALPPGAAAASEARCPDEPQATGVALTERAGGLRDLAAPLGLAVGSAIQGDLGGTYRQVATREFGVATPGNEMKWAAVHPRRDAYDFCAADRIVAMARGAGMRVRGHTLAWNSQNPPWLETGTFTREETIAILRDHIRTVVGHFRTKFPGTVYQWDVVNEPVEDCAVDPADPRHRSYDAATGACTLRHTLWLDRIGPDYIELALRFAHEADPAALLFVNEYGVERGGADPLAKRRGLTNLVSALQSARAPIGGVGLQFHLSRGGPDPLVLRRLMDDFASLGLQVAVTELDVGMAATGPAWVPPPADLELQAQQYRQVLEACLGTTACRTFVMWGFSDSRSWRWLEQPCIFDRDFQPKPAYEALRSGLRQALRGFP